MRELSEELIAFQTLQLEELLCSYPLQAPYEQGRQPLAEAVEKGGVVRESSRLKRPIHLVRQVPQRVLNHVGLEFGQRQRREAGVRRHASPFVLPPARNNKGKSDVDFAGCLYKMVNLAEVQSQGTGALRFKQLSAVQQAEIRLSG
jgi:hypothetical protein